MEIPALRKLTLEGVSGGLLQTGIHSEACKVIAGGRHYGTVFCNHFCLDKSGLFYTFKIIAVVTCHFHFQTICAGYGGQGQFIYSRIAFCCRSRAVMYQFSVQKNLIKAGTGEQEFLTRGTFKPGGKPCLNVHFIRQTF